MKKTMQDWKKTLQEVQLGSFDSSSFLTALSCKNQIDSLDDIREDLLDNDVPIREVDERIDLIESCFKHLGIPKEASFNFCDLDEDATNRLYEDNGGTFTTYPGNYYQPDEVEIDDETLYERCEYKVMLDSYIEDIKDDLYNGLETIEERTGAKLNTIENADEVLDSIRNLHLEEDFKENRMTQKELDKIVNEPVRQQNVRRRSSPKAMAVGQDFSL